MSRKIWYVCADIAYRGIFVQHCKTKAEAEKTYNRLKKYNHPIVYGLSCYVDSLYKSSLDTYGFSACHGKSVKQVSDILTICK